MWVSIFLKHHRWCLLTFETHCLEGKSTFGNTFQEYGVAGKSSAATLGGF
jgi:hypothetical protein